MTETRREEAVRLRTQFGLRADPQWLDHVEATGELIGPHGPGLGVPMSPDEYADMAARHDRGMTIGRAVREADLDSGAGCWIDQRAGGVVHVLLARPSAAERAVADRIVAGQKAVVDLVAHTTRELDAIRELIRTESDRSPAFHAAITAYGISTDDNHVHLLMRDDCDPEVPASLRAAVEAGQLEIEYSAARFVEE